MDKNGIAFGKLFFTAGANHRESLSLCLVKEGLAKIDRYLINRGVSGIEDLVAAQEEVKAKGTGVWSVPEEEEVKSTTSPMLGTRVGQLARIRVSEIMSGSSFYVHVLDTDSPVYPPTPLHEVEQMMVSFEEGVRPEISGESGPLRKGHLCVCRYPAEPGKWFRAKVLEVLESSHLRVLYLDYGNTGTIASDQVCLACFD